MKNTFEICGDVVLLVIRYKRLTLRAIIDLADLPKAQSFGGTWRAHKHHRSGKFYVVAYGGRIFARFLMDAPRGMKVDHVDHDPLNNRRKNLRIVTNSVNILNREGPAADNRSSGMRGVNATSYNHQKFQARVKVQGKSHYLGLFDTKELALKAVQAKLREIGVPNVA